MSVTSSVPSSQGCTGLGLLGLTWRPTSASDEQAFGAMKAAIAQGATFWFTAEFYGTPNSTEGMELLNRCLESYTVRQRLP